MNFSELIGSQLSQAAEDMVQDFIDGLFGMLMRNTEPFPNAFPPERLERINKMIDNFFDDRRAKRIEVAAEKEINPLPIQLERPHDVEGPFPDVETYTLSVNEKTGRGVFEHLSTDGVEATYAIQRGKTEDEMMSWAAAGAAQFAVNRGDQEFVLKAPEGTNPAVFDRARDVVADSDSGVKMSISIGETELPVAGKMKLSTTVIAKREESQGEEESSEVSNSAHDEGESIEPEVEEDRAKSVDEEEARENVDSEELGGGQENRAVSVQEHVTDEHASADEVVAGELPGAIKEGEVGEQTTEESVVEKGVAGEAPAMEKSVEVKDPVAVEEPAVVEGTISEKQPDAVEETAAAEKPVVVDQLDAEAEAVTEDEAVAVEQSAAEEPVAEKESSTVEKAVAVEEPATVEKSAAIEERAAEEPVVVDEPVVDEPAAGVEPVTSEEPVAVEEPVAGEQVEGEQLRDVREISVEETASSVAPAAFEEPTAENGLVLPDYRQSESIRHKPPVQE